MVYIKKGESLEYNYEALMMYSRPPCWSWATFPGAAGMGGWLKEDAELVDLGVTLASPLDPLSNVAEGYISIRGKVELWTAANSDSRAQVVKAW